MAKYRLKTIGHSNQTQEELLALLRMHDVNCIVDVRSVPASKYSPQFNEEELKRFLKRNGIAYLHFGKEFGARRADCIDDGGQVDFEMAVQTSAFLQGVERLYKGVEMGYRISLMCSEADPLECHRFSLVSRYFYERGFEVSHILKGGNLATHEDLENEMILQYLHCKNHHLPEVDELFGSYSKEMQRRDAYRMKNKEIGFCIQPDSTEGD